MHARSGNGEAAAAAGEGEEGEGEVLELAGTSKMQDPEDAPLFASGSPQPPLEGSGGGGRASAAEEKAALSESKIDFPTARDLADRPIYATGSYQWEEELAQTRGVGAVDAGAAGDDYANDSDDGGAGGDGADGGDSSSDYSDDFESDDEEREGAKDDEARAREQRDLETVLSLCRQHALDPSARQPAAAATEVVRGAGAAPAPAPAASARSRSPRSQRLAQKEARLRDQLGSATFDQLFRYFVSQLTYARRRCQPVTAYAWPADAPCCAAAGLGSLPTSAGCAGWWDPTASGSGCAWRWRSSPSRAQPACSPNTRHTTPCAPPLVPYPLRRYRPSLSESSRSQAGMSVSWARLSSRFH